MKYCLLLLLFSFLYNADQGEYYKKILFDDIYLLIPNAKSINKDSTYVHIKLFKGEKLIFEDKSLTEYIIDNEFWPYFRKLDNGNVEILIKVFDAPDYDKIHGIYLSNNKLKEIVIYPDFSDDLKKATRCSILSGYMNISEAPCDNCDSCYYNPKLCFRLGNNGIYLDSALTRQENIKRWGGFYGFHLTEKVILPCKRK